MTLRRAAPVSRRDRPAKPPLSREGIVATAIAVMRHEGLEAATMRRLARELDTGSASLYVYFHNTAELHGAILDELLGTVDLTADAASGWRPRLVDLLLEVTALLYAYPSLARSALVLRPAGPRYLRLWDTLLQLLYAGGACDRQASWGVDVLLQLATATAVEQGSRRETGAVEAEDTEFTEAFRAAPPGSYPSIVRAAAHLTASGPDKLRWVFETMIDGILAAGR